MLFFELDSGSRVVSSREMLAMMKSECPMPKVILKEHGKGRWFRGKLFLYKRKKNLNSSVFFAFLSR